MCLSPLLLVSSLLLSSFDLVHNPSHSHINSFPLHVHVLIATPRYICACLHVFLCPPPSLPPALAAVHAWQPPSRLWPLLRLRLLLVRRHLLHHVDLVVVLLVEGLRCIVRLQPPTVKEEAQRVEGNPGARRDVRTQFKKWHRASDLEKLNVQRK